MTYERELQQLGFSEKEAKVYFAVLEFGSATMQEIAQKTGIRRPTVYVAVEKLMQSGLVSYHERGKKRYVSAEFPERLLEFVSQKEDQFRSQKAVLMKILPELKRLFEYAGERPKIRFFEGKEGLRSIQEDFLRAKTEEAFEIFSLDDITAVFSIEERRAQLAKRLKKHIAMKALYAREAGPLTDYVPMAEMRYLDPRRFPLSIDLLIYGQKIAIASLRGKLVGVIIENRAIAETFRSIFALAWRGAAKK